jgi:hypothetical protein
VPFQFQYKDIQFPDEWQFHPQFGEVTDSTDDELHSILSANHQASVSIGAAKPLTEMLLLLKLEHPCNPCPQFSLVRHGIHQPLS